MCQYPHIHTLAIARRMSHPSRTGAGELPQLTRLLNAGRVLGRDVHLELYDIPTHEVVMGRKTRRRPNGRIIATLLRDVVTGARNLNGASPPGSGANGAPGAMQVEGQDLDDRSTPLGGLGDCRVVAFVEEPQIIPGSKGGLSGYWSAMYHGLYAGEGGFPRLRPAQRVLGLTRAAQQ